jgi:hypothetical protein
MPEPSSTVRSQPGVADMTARRRTLITIAAGLAVALATAGVALLVRHDRPAIDARAAAADAPAIVAGAPAAHAAPARAVCPATIDIGTRQTRPSRAGALVPSGATQALLCSYPLIPGTSRLPLGRSRPLGTDPIEVITYLNGLPETLPEREVCLGIGRTQYAIVFGYADHDPATVRLACGYDQDGAVRRGGDLRRVLSFWGVPVDGV